MILTEFPNLEWLKAQAESRFANRKSWSGKELQKPGWPNVVLNVASNTTIRDNVRGSLSIFSNFSGQSRVSVDRKSVLVKEGFFFISNYDQYYTLEIEKHQRAETCNIHFGEYFVDEVFQSRLRTHEQLLEEIFENPIGRMEFNNQLFRCNDTFQQVLKDLCGQEDSNIGFEEKLFQLVSLMLADQKELRRQQYLLPPVKLSTRLEIMKRLGYATDYIYSNYNLSFSLDDLARESQLSKFHFLRLFTAAYGVTPHQFINSLRVERAKSMLTRKTNDVKSVGREVGFTNSSSFSRMFFQHVGVYPSQFAAG